MNVVYRWLTAVRRSTSLRISAGKTPGSESESGSSTQDSTSSLSYIDYNKINKTSYMKLHKSLLDTECRIGASHDCPKNSCI